MTNKRGFLFFHMEKYKVAEKEECKKTHGQHRHTICDSFLILFGFRSRPFCRIGLLLAVFVVHIYLYLYSIAAMCVCEFILDILTIRISMCKFLCICHLILEINNFRHWCKSLCSIYRLGFFWAFVTVSLVLNLLINEKNQNKLVAYSWASALPLISLSAGPVFIHASNIQE